MSRHWILWLFLRVLLLYWAQELRLCPQAGPPGEWMPVLASLQTQPLPPRPSVLRAPLLFVPDNPVGAAPYSPGQCAGKIVVMEEGRVTFDTKVSRAVTARRWPLTARGYRTLPRRPRR